MRDGWRSPAWAIALIAPALMPGFGSKGFLDFSTNGSGSVSLDPLVNIASDLSSTQDLPVFTVETKYPTYYRSVALTNFDGSRWTPDPNADTREVNQGDLAAPTEIDPTTLNATQGATYDFEADNLILGPYLPLPYPATNLTLNQPLAFDASGSSIGLPEPVGPGTSYRAYAKVIDPTPDQLRQASTVLPTPDPADVALPLDTREKIEPIAKSWVGSETNMYDQVMAIERRFQSRFQYDSDDREQRPQPRAPRIPHQDEEGVLSAVRRGDGRDAAVIGYPRAGRHRIHRGTADGRGHLPSYPARRPRLGRGPIPDVRVAHVRPHPGCVGSNVYCYNNPDQVPPCKGKGCGDIGGTGPTEVDD